MALLALTIKLAWRGETWAPPMDLPFQPRVSMILPAVAKALAGKPAFWALMIIFWLVETSIGGFLKTQPAEFIGWVRDFWEIVSLIN